MPTPHAWVPCLPLHRHHYIYSYCVVLYTSGNQFITDIPLRVNCPNVATTTVCGVHLHEMTVSTMALEITDSSAPLDLELQVPRTYWLAETEKQMGQFHGISLSENTQKLDAAPCKRTKLNCWVHVFRCSFEKRTIEKRGISAKESVCGNESHFFTDAKHSLAQSWFRSPGWAHLCFDILMEANEWTGCYLTQQCGDCCHKLQSYSRAQKNINRTADVLFVPRGPPIFHKFHSSLNEQGHAVNCFVKKHISHNWTAVLPSGNIRTSA